LPPALLPQTGSPFVKYLATKIFSEPLIFFTVSVPKTPEQPKPEQPKETPKFEAPAPAPQVAAAELPQTGASEFAAPLAALTAGGGAYLGRLLVIKRRQK